MNDHTETENNSPIEKKEGAVYKEIKEWIESLAIVGGIVLIIWFFIQPTLVKGDSMSPTIQDSNYLLIEKLSYKFREPEFGEIVVVKSHLPENAFRNKDLIKRVIGLPGDKVAIHDGIVIRNGKPLEESYVSQHYTHGDLDVTVPDKSVFIMGDNRGVSRDSRDPAVGFIPYDQIKGKILWRLYPFNELGEVK